MTVFNPEENTMICMYGPPGFTVDPAETSPYQESELEIEEETFFSKIVNLFKKFFEFIKNLFVK